MALGINILCTCAYLNSDNIPLALLFTWMKATHKVDELSFKDCIEGLERYSMFKTDATTLSIHRVAQQVIRHQQSGAIPTEGIAFPGLTSLWYGSLLKAANQEFNRKTQVLEDEARERALLVHLQALQSSLNSAWEKELSEDLGEALDNIGIVFLRQGRLREAQQSLQNALRCKEMHFGKEHSQLAITLNNLGNAYGDLGDAKQQKALLERALKIEEAHYGKDHAEVAITLGNLGNAYGALGDAKQKKALLERALTIQEAHYGKDHVEVAITLSNLGNAYGDLGDAKEQKELLLRALKIKEAYYGKDHAQVAITLSSLGNAYGALGDAKQQKELLERALKIQEAHYGKDHVEVAITLSNLGNAYGDLGDAKEQKELLLRALKIKEAYYGKDHAQVAITLSSLGNAYGALGDAKQQKELLERALKIQEAYYGKDHTEVAITLFNLGVAYRGLKLISEAQSYVLRAHHIFAKEYGAGHSHTLKAKELIKSCQELLAKPQSAIAVPPLIFFHSAGDGITELQKILLRRKTERDKGLPSVEVAFLRAAAKGLRAEVEFLIKNVRDINFQDGNPASKRTALHWAAKNKHQEVFDFLVSQGAKLEIKDAEGKTAEDYRKLFPNAKK